MIVVGAHGWGPLGRVLHGSVSGSLLDDPPCPVLVVRGEPRRPAEKGGVMRPVMLATDGSASAEAATQEARSEERRVGKECRSRWSPDTLKKKIVIKSA